ncbi:hypothetical protein [Neisseria lactamica]|uniref:hypothetical protein n=1 Tax=Neisseria lactamica TaxID=486 RepID=UPI000E0FE45E|nr:hypothetical protein [Neisseria lactamica]
MKIKNILIVFIIVGGISYALYCSLITDFLLKYGETIHTKAVVEERLTGKSSYPVLRYRFFYHGQAYIGFVSEISCLRVSDTINVVFLKSNPSMNRPLYKKGCVLILG